MKQLISDDELTTLGADQNYLETYRAIEKLATERALRLAAEVCEETNTRFSVPFEAVDRCRDAILKLMEQ